MGQSTVTTWTEAIHRNEILQAERILAEIRVRLKFAEEAELAAQSRVDIGRLVRAVDGVLALHRPASHGGCRICRGGYWICARRRSSVRPWGWPCATVRTVSRTLVAPPLSCSIFGAGQRTAEGVSG